MGRAFLLAITLAKLLMAQGPTSFKTGISLVELDASVFEEGGIVEGLKQEDFMVKD
jgi:hypothetical protein